MRGDMNDKAPGAASTGGHDGDERSVHRGECRGSGDPMHGEEAADLRDHGMEQVLDATADEDREAIRIALMRGLDATNARRAEDALAVVAFVWPPSAPARCLGAIVRHLARTGHIIEDGWTKGRTGRSRAGRVSLWRKVTP